MQFEVVADDLGFAEGPVVGSDGTIWVTSIDRGLVYRLDRSGLKTVFPVGAGANGAALSLDGSLLIAQNGGWNPTVRLPGSTGSLQRLAADGSSSVLTTDPVAPNDLCIGPDGFVYLTDPSRRRPARDDGRIWRIDGATGTSELLRSVAWYPNGIGFGIDPDALFVANMGQQRIERFERHDATASNALGAQSTYLQLRDGYPDGFAFDCVGNLIICAVELDRQTAGSIQVWSPSGELLEMLRPGSSPLYTNVAVDDAGTFFITDSANGLLLRGTGWPVPGLPLHPFRSLPTPSREFH